MTDAELVRFTLGATGDNSGLLDDSDIDTQLALYDDWRLAAAALAEVLAARAINDPGSFTLTGVMQVSWADRAKSWMAIAKNLRAEVARMALQAAGPVGMQVKYLRLEYEASGEAEYIPPRAYHGLER